MMIKLEGSINMFSYLVNTENLNDKKLNEAIYRRNLISCQTKFYKIFMKKKYKNGVKNSFYFAKIKCKTDM
jgi:hypothetical protein